MDVEDYSSEDELKRRIEILSEIRRRHRGLARKIKQLAAKDGSLKEKNLEELYCRDAIDQKIFTVTFRGKDLHNIFREDLQVETLTR